MKWRLKMMERKIGKLSFLLLLICGITFGLYAEINVSIQALSKSSRKPVEIVGVGIPFILEVVVKNGPDSAKAPDIDGLDSFKILSSGSSTNIMTINGVTTKKRIFQYVVSAGQPGKHVLGPAVVEVENDVYRSGQTQLEVSMQAPSDNTKEQNEKKQVAIEIFVDKNHVKVGEQIIFGMKVSSPGGNISIDKNNVNLPKLEGFSFSSLDGPRKKREKIGDDFVDCFLWRCLIFPKETGEIIIPAVPLNYEEVSRRRGRASVWDLIGFGGPSIVRKQTYSNSIKIVVDKLPVTKNPTNAVGTFHSFSAKVDKNKAQEGDGIVYSLALEGKGNLEMIVPPRLNIPSTLKYYESSQNIEKNDENYPDRKKTFSYIVQGVKHGNWEIPPQSFTYFDSLSKSYKTIKSNSVMLYIERMTSVSVQKTDHSEAEDHDKADAMESNVNNGSLLPIDVDGPWYSIPQRKISWIIFFIIAAAFGVFGLFRVLFGRFLAHRKFTESDRKRKRAFKNAYKDLCKKQKNQDVSGLYALFNNMLAQRLGIDKELLTQDYLDRVLLAKGMSVEDFALWQDFYNSLAEHTFFSKAIKSFNQNKLFELAKKWIEQLEKIL